MEVNASLIKNYRHKKCWSQLQLAEMAGISMRTLQRVESTSSASLETIKSIAAVLEMDVSEFLEMQEPPRSEKQDENVKNSRTQRRNLIVGLTLVCVVNAGALGILFYEHGQGNVSDAAFFFLKNLVSVTTVLSVGITIWQGVELRHAIWMISGGGNKNATAG